MRIDADRVKDILEAIDKIEARVPDEAEVFLADEMFQVWAIHHLQIIGEAARGLSQEFKDAHSTVPWRQIVGLRHILVHEYFGINLQQVWTMVTGDLPALREQIRTLL
jgi:uncharacterized protein with HEPN domain